MINRLIFDSLPINKEKNILIYNYCFLFLLSLFCLKNNLSLDHNYTFQNIFFMKSLDQARETLLKLYQKGHTQRVIELLLSLNLNISIQTLVNQIAAEQSQLNKKKIGGTISPSEADASQNRINERLIHLINENEAIYTISPERKKPFIKKKTLLIIGLMSSLLFISYLIISLQLTIYIEDEKGNVILENNGELVVNFGNDRRTAMIGEDGRTNFGEIPIKFLWSKIKIGFDVQGYQIVDKKNEFIFKGKPIHLVVSRDNSLGIIEGQVKYQNEFVADALVLINNDTTVLTDKLGIFKIILPPHMRVNSLEEKYNLTITKDGYISKLAKYYPTASTWEVFLTKKEL